MVQMEQKTFKGTRNVPLSQNEVLRDPMVAKCYLLWHIIVLNWHFCLVWPYVALNEWPYLASNGHVAFLAHGHMWLHSTWHGIM